MNGMKHRMANGWRASVNKIEESTQMYYIWVSVYDMLYIHRTKIQTMPTSKTVPLRPISCDLDKRSEIHVTLL